MNDPIGQKILGKGKRRVGRILQRSASEPRFTFCSKDLVPPDEPHRRPVRGSSHNRKTLFFVKPCAEGSRRSSECLKVLGYVPPAPRRQKLCSRRLENSRKGSVTHDT